MFAPKTSPWVVLLASVLKPVDDTRMREKFAQTLLDLPNSQIHVAGREPVGPVTDRADKLSGVYQHRLLSGTRLSLDRLAAQLRYWRLLHRLRPSLVFVHAPELLPLTLLWQRLGGGPARRFVYDIQENYALNVRTQGVYRGLTRRLLAAGLRRTEALASRRAVAVILAEASYADELPFLARLPAGRVLILENKYQPGPAESLPPPARPKPAATAPLRLLFSGTISELNGVREAIELTRALRAIRPGGARLTIIGFCQQPELASEIERLATHNANWLTLVGGARPVPHAAIVAAIGQADFGLLPYRPHPSTAHCRPTKLFEYLALALPVLVPANPLWTALVRQHQAGLEVDFSQPETAAATIIAAAAAAFYPRGAPPEARWESEAKKLRHLVETLR